MYPESPYIAFFDVDQTLISVNSGKFLVGEGYKKGLIPAGFFIPAVFFPLLIRCHLADPLKVMGKMAGWVKGFPEETVRKLSGEVCQTYLIPAIRSEIIQEIEFHKERKARIVLLSSALSYICLPLAGHLGLDDVICSVLELRDGRFTGRFSGNVCYGEEKVNRLRQYCGKMNASPEHAYYYGDSISDFQVLDSVGHPRCVSPDKKLTRMAGLKHWEIFQCH